MSGKNNFAHEVERPYGNGVEAGVWHLYIGDAEKRLQNYRSTLLKILKEHDTKFVLDIAACTGIDSVMLVEAGYKVNSTDAVESFLNEARRIRWQRRNEPGFGDWNIGYADWLDMHDCDKDIKHPEGGYDAIICIGNSFCCLPDFEGEQKTLKRALRNMNELLRPGGVLIIDHRNYDYIIKHCVYPANGFDSIYYNSTRLFDVNTSVKFDNGKCTMTATGMYLDLSGSGLENTTKGVEQRKRDGKTVTALKLNTIQQYPHTVKSFTEMLEETFKPAEHKVLPDFRDDGSKSPVYWVHVVTKPN